MPDYAGLYVKLIVRFGSVPATIAFVNWIKSFKDLGAYNSLFALGFADCKPGSPVALW